MTSPPATNLSAGWKPKACAVHLPINEKRIVWSDVLKQWMLFSGESATALASGIDGCGHRRHCQLTIELRFRNST
jgi:hypothetical protein